MSIPKNATLEEKRELNRKRIYGWRSRHPEKAKTYAAGTEHRGKLKRYGITQEDFDSMQLVVPGCAICGKRPKKRLAIDHDHKTGRVRGLLCIECNLAIGLLRDSPELLLSAWRYLT